MQEQKELAQAKEAPLIAVQPEESAKMYEFQKTLALHMQQQTETMQRQQMEMQKNFSTVYVTCSRHYCLSSGQKDCSFNK